MKFPAKVSEIGYGLAALTLSGAVLLFVYVTAMHSLGTTASEKPVGQMENAPKAARQEALAEYIKLGGTYGGWLMEDGGLFWHDGGGTLPGFAFRQFPKGPLPDLVIPFGLSFVQCEVTR